MLDEVQLLEDYQLDYKVYEDRENIPKYISEVFINLVHMLSNGAGIDDIGKIAYEMLGNPIIITDVNHKVIYFSKVINIDDPIWNQIIDSKHCPSNIIEKLDQRNFWKRLHESDGPLFVDTGKLPDLGRKAIVKVKSEGEVKSYIALLEYNKKIADIDVQVLRMIAELVGAKLVEENAISRAKDQLSKEFIGDLLKGEIINEKIAQDRADSIQWNTKNYFTVVNISSQHREENLEKNIKPLISLIKEYSPYTKWSAGLKNIYLIVNHVKKEDCIDFIEKRIGNYCRDKHLILGIGSTVGTFKDITKSYKEAKKTIEIVQSSFYNKKNHMIHYSEIALLDLLDLTIETNKRHIQQYYSKNIIKLIQEDKINNTQYIDTLKSYFNHNQNPTETAKFLYVHRNTINYRLNKIRQIIEDDFDNPLIRLHMDITLRMLDRMN